MADKKKEKPKGGRPSNWREICMKRVPVKGSVPPKAPEK